MYLRKELIYVLLNDHELRQYVRQHPYWYRTLSRDPNELYTLQKEADYFYGRTFPQRVEQVRNQLGLAMMMIELFQMNKQTEAAEGPVEDPNN